MATALLFVLCTLIWGSTWYAITFQLGTVPIEWSVAYRFFLAAGLLLAYCALTGKRLRFSLSEHALFAGLGALLFSVNYMLVYTGTIYLTSGLVAVVFSMMTLTNQFNGAIFLKQRLEPRVVVGAVLGLGGLALVFWPEFERFTLTGATAQGIGICLLGTLSASLGNTLAASARGQSMPIFQFNGFAMLYGAALMAAFALVRDAPPAFDWSAPYLLSLVYLAVLGTVVAFTIYLTLLKSMGLSRAGYIAVAIPVVALAISTLFEGYRWNWQAAAGVALVIAGNLLLRRRRAKPAHAPQPAAGAR